MTHFALPKINYDISPKNIKLQFDNKDDLNIHINKSLSNYLKMMKKQIASYPQWDNFKKFCNPYEYIHTHFQGLGSGVSKIKPLSRSFFKMIEIYNVFKLDDDYRNKHIDSFHLAEGPGGFIEALCYLRKNQLDRYYGMTLLDNNDTNVPGWKKAESFLKKNPHVYIETGIDGTGNLYNHKNLQYCIKKYRNSMDLITADGGFDFSIDYDKQELLALRLIFSQIVFAISLQKKGGNFILKVFDMFFESSVDLIYLLSCFYTKVNVIKPNTSRFANSEKYIICKNFKYTETKAISDKFISVFRVLDKLDYNKLQIKRFLNIPIQYYYITQIIEINAIFGQQQIITILSTLKLIADKDNDIIRNNKLRNLKRCVQWCTKYNIPHYKNVPSSNGFLSNKKYLRN